MKDCLHTLILGKDLVPSKNINKYLLVRGKEKAGDLLELTCLIFKFLSITFSGCSPTALAMAPASLRVWVPGSGVGG